MQVDNASSPGREKKEEEKFIFVRKHWVTPSGRTVGNCRTAEEKEREGGRKKEGRDAKRRAPKIMLEHPF